MLLKQTSPSIAALIGLLLFTGVPAPAREATHQWNELNAVKNVALIPPVYVTAIASSSKDPGHGSNYRQALARLKSEMGSSLRHGISLSNRFKLVPEARVNNLMRRQKLTADKLFRPSKKGDWRDLDVAKAGKLVRELGVDGLMLCQMREPASVADGFQLRHDPWNINVLNLSLQRYKAHVVSPSARAVLINRRGAIVWQDEEVAFHPRTHPRTWKTLLVDWDEVTQQAAQQLTDSLTLPPPVTTGFLLRTLPPQPASLLYFEETGL